MSLKHISDMAEDLHGKAQRKEVPYDEAVTSYLGWLTSQLMDREMTAFACKVCKIDLRGEFLPHRCRQAELDALRLEALRQRQSEEIAAAELRDATVRTAQAHILRELRALLDVTTTTDSLRERVQQIWLRYSR